MPQSQSSGQRTVEQVADRLIERIADGVWGKTSPLPSLEDLAREYETSEDTIRSALNQLHSEKLISRQAGGRFAVTDVQARALSIRFSNLMTASGTRLAGSVIRASMEQSEASPTEANRLGIDIGAPVCRVHRLRGNDGVPFMVETATLPLAIFPGLMDAGRVPFRTPVLCRRYGLTVRHAEEHVSLGSAGADVAVAIGVRYGTPLFVLERVLYTGDGTALEYRVGQTLMKDLKYVTRWSAGAT